MCSRVCQTNSLVRRQDHERLPCRARHNTAPVRSNITGLNSPVVWRSRRGPIREVQRGTLAVTRNCLISKLTAGVQGVPALIAGLFFVPKKCTSIFQISTYNFDPFCPYRAGVFDSSWFFCFLRRCNNNRFVLSALRRVTSPSYMLEPLSHVHVRSSSRVNEKLVEN